MLEKPQQTSFILNNSLSELERLHGMLERIKDEWQLTEKYMLQLNLVLDELFTNIISYGYETSSEEQVAVTLTNCGDIIEIIICDSGKPFDPTSAKKPKTDCSLAETPNGGLGIFLVHQYIDTIHYQRTEDKNILTLTKKI
jgi:serine/threonine-protein kinase RsbW